MAFAPRRCVHFRSLRSLCRDTEGFCSNEFEATRFVTAACATLDPLNLRRRLALVPQDLFILSGSIAENICFVRPETSLEQVGRP